MTVHSNAIDEEFIDSYMRYGPCYNSEPKMHSGVTSIWYKQPPTADSLLRTMF